MHLTLYISTDCKTTTQNLNEICLNKFSWGLKSLRILTPPHSPRFCLLVFRFLTAALESTSKTGSPAVHLFFHSVTDTHADRRVICSNSIHLAPVAVLSKVRVCGVCGSLTVQRCCVPVSSSGCVDVISVHTRWLRLTFTASFINNDCCLTRTTYNYRSSSVFSSSPHPFTAFI